MVRRSKPVILILILCLILVGSFFSQAHLFGSSERLAEGAKDGFDGRARVFVKGDHAYVIRIDEIFPPSSYLWVFDVGVVGESLQETVFTEPCCDSLFIPYASDLFVSGDYLYVGGVINSSSCVLKKYDISDPCDPEFVDSAVGYTEDAMWVTEIYITGDRAYLAIDASGVAVFEVSDTLFEWKKTFYTNYSSQGVHVRGSYMYVGNEGGGLWVCDLSSDSNYYADTTNGASRDAYNIVCNGKSRTYEITDFNLYIWDTDDLHTITKVGSNNEISGDIVHITGYWVYTLATGSFGGQIDICGLVCDGKPHLKTSYGDSVHDFHVVHDRRGHAHIYGVKPNYGPNAGEVTDTAHVTLWYKRALHEGLGRLYKCGDINVDWKVDVADLYVLSRYVIAGDNFPVRDLDACDLNCDGEVNTDDFEYLENYLFHQGPAPGADCEFYH